MKKLIAFTSGLLYSISLWAQGDPCSTPNPPPWCNGLAGPCAGANPPQWCATQVPLSDWYWEIGITVIILIVVYFKFIKNKTYGKV